MGSQGREDSCCHGRTKTGGCGMNRAGSLTTGRHCGPTFGQINREGRTQSGGERGRQSGW